MTRGETKTPNQASDATNERAAFAMPRPSPTLAALTTSALALPGIAGNAGKAFADAPIERATASSSFSYYREDQLPQRKLATGSPERYEVFAKQLRFDIPTTDRTDIGIGFLYESMSGASPWFVSLGPSGELEQAMTGATIDDERYDLNVDLDYYLDRGKDTFSTGFSKENDYLSLHWGLGAERHFNDKNTTANVSGAFAYDWIEPTGGGLGSRIKADEKWSLDLFAGLAQIVSRASTVQFTINYKHSEGFLSDPYKLVQQIAAGGGVNFNDARPDKKDQVSLLARYRHHFEDVEGSLHLDYRLYTDSWEMVSHTVEIGWYQNLFQWLTVSPGFRWYSQSKAEFYEAILPSGPLPEHRSSDYRLSPYGAISAKIRFDFELLDALSYDPGQVGEALGITEGLDLIASLSYERYLSDGHFSVESIGEFDQNPGLVNFQVIAFTLSGKF